MFNRPEKDRRALRLGRLDHRGERLVHARADHALRGEHEEHVVPGADLVGADRPKADEA